MMDPCVLLSMTKIMYVWCTNCWNQPALAARKFIITWSTQKSRAWHETESHDESMTIKWCNITLWIQSPVMGAFLALTSGAIHAYVPTAVVCSWVYSKCRAEPRSQIYRTFIIYNKVHIHSNLVRSHFSTNIITWSELGLWLFSLYTWSGNESIWFM